MAQQLTPPADPPANLPRTENLIPSNIAPGFSFYIEPMTAGMDPYMYCPW